MNGEADRLLAELARCGIELGLTPNGKALAIRGRGPGGPADRSPPTGRGASPTL